LPEITHFLRDNDVNHGDHLVSPTVFQQLGKLVSAEVGHRKQPTHVEHLEITDPLPVQLKDRKKLIDTKTVQEPAILTLDKQDNGL
jgi:hypothetical protein